MDFSVFAWVGDAIEELTNTMIVKSTAGLIDMLSPFLVSAVTLYLIYQAYLYIFGKTDDLPRDIVLTCLLIIFITTMTLNTDNYTRYVLDTIHGWETGLTTSLIPSSNPSSSSVFGLLDQVLATAVEQIAFCFQKLSVLKASTWGWLIAGIVVAIAYLPLVISAAIIIIGAKFLLTTLLTIGPLFISFAIFPATRKWFDNWLSKTFEQCLVMALGILVTTFAMVIFQKYIAVNSITTPGVNPGTTAIMVLPVGWILRYVITQIPNLAGSISGGFASAVLTSRNVADGMAGDYRKVVSPLVGAGKDIIAGYKDRAPGTNSVSQGNPAQTIVMDNINKHTPSS